MLKYPKIETLFDRDPDTFKVIPDLEHLRRPEFGVIARWVVTEKVDGTNIRIGRTRRDDPPRAEGVVLGRTDKAQIPPDLLAAGHKIAESAALAAVMDEHDLDSITLYGEGYGAKIQSGGDYRDDQGFILFDVHVNGRAWLDDRQVSEVADALGIPRVPLLDYGAPFTLAEIVEWVREKPSSECAARPRPAEGIVARPKVPLYDRRGERVMFKLKAKDFG